MKRLFAIGLSLLLLVGFSADAVEISDCALQRYVDWNVGIQRGLGGRLFGQHVLRYGFKETDSLCGALAVAPDGSWATGTASADRYYGSWRCGHISYRKARTAAVKHCNERFNTDSCRIPKRNEFTYPLPSFKTAGGSNIRMKTIYSAVVLTEVSADGRYWCTEISKPPYRATPKECKAVNGVRWTDKQKADLLYLYISTDPTPIFGRPEDDANCGTAIATAPSTPPKKEEPKQEASGSSSTASSSNKIWCATKDSVTWISKNYCRQEGGKSYSYKTQAKAEHNRLKLGSSSSSSSTASIVEKRVWCATALTVKRISESACKSEGGTGYDGRAGSSSPPAEASIEHRRLKAEHKRLAEKYNVKTASLTIRSNVTGDKVYIDGNFKGSTRLDLKLSKGRHTIRIEKDGYETYEESINLTDNLIIRGHLIKVVDEPVKTVVVDNTVEVEFWNSIKGSDDPEEYRIYLDEYPTGKFAKLAKLRIKKLGGTSTSVAQSSIPNLDYGDYYALVIGNNRYDHLSDLRTAVNDARGVANLLELDYGFNVTTLENANRDQIINSISGLRSKVTSEDNVLIYYAGHGVLDEDADEGYWLPVDASRDNPANWVMTDQVISQVRAMKAKHVMVVADSCFSGTITRGIKIEQRTPEWLETIVKKKARTALTSGGLEPVMDSGGGNNSVFANSFLSILRDNDGVLDASQLFSQLRPKVMVNSDQTPEYGDIHRAGHDGGDFLFVRQ